MKDYVGTQSRLGTVILSENCSLRDQRREQPQSKDPYHQENRSATGGSVDST